MSDTSTAPAFLDTLTDALTARPGLDGVQVVSGPLGEASAPESIQFGSVEAPQDYSFLGKQRREENYVIHGVIWIVAPGADEPTIRAARERAYALAGEVERALRDDPTMGGTAHVAQYAGANLEQGVHPSGRWAQLDITLNVKAYVVSG